MIALLINELDIRGGTHKQFLKLLEYMDRQEVAFYIITRHVDFTKTYPDFQKFSSKIVLFPQTRKRGLMGKIYHLIKDTYVLRKLLKPATVVNIHDCGFELYLPAFIGKRVYWQINDFPAYFRVGVFNKLPQTYKHRFFRKYILLFRSVVTAFSVNVSKNRDRVKQCFNRDAFVFYCGIEPIRINRNIDASLQRFHNNSIRILSSGVFLPYRNYETQLMVVEKLLNKGIDVHLDIIGSTDLNVAYSNKIKSLVKEKSLEQNVSVHGQVDESTFASLHANADIFIFINIDQSWGLAVFEAMSCGLPVIVSKSVGATEILSDGKNAIFVNPVDVDTIVEKIAMLMNSESEYLRLVRNSKEFYTRYTWDNAYCSKMLALMQGN